MSSFRNALGNVSQVHANNMTVRDDFVPELGLALFDFPATESVELGVA